MIADLRRLAATARRAAAVLAARLRDARARADRRSARPRRPPRRPGRAGLRFDRGARGRLGRGAAQLLGNQRRQSVGRRRRPRRDRLRRRAVPARGRHERARRAARRSHARAVRRAGPRRSFACACSTPGEAARVDTPNTQLALTRPGPVPDRGERGPRPHDARRARRRGDGGRAPPALQQVLPGQSATRARRRSPSQADVRAGYALDGFDTWSADRDRRYERSRTRELRVAADDRLRRSRRARPLGVVARVRHGLVSDDGRGRLGAVPLRPLELGRGLRLDVGRRCAVGLRAVPLRPLGARRQPLGMVPGRLRRASRVGAGAGRLVRRIGLGRLAYRSARRSTAGCRSAGASRTCPSWRNCSNRCWTRYNRPYAVNRAERPHAPPTRYANWSAPGGVTAVPGAIFTGRQPVHANVVALRPQAIANAPVLAQAPVLAKPTAATIPGAKPSIAAPPPAVRFQTQAAAGRARGCAGNLGRRTSGLAVRRACRRPSHVPASHRRRAPLAATPAAPVAAPAATRTARPTRPAWSHRAPAPTYAPGTWGAPSSPAPARASGAATRPVLASASRRRAACRPRGTTLRTIPPPRDGRARLRAAHRPRLPCDPPPTSRASLRQRAGPQLCVPPTSGAALPRSAPPAAATAPPAQAVGPRHSAAPSAPRRRLRRRRKASAGCAASRTSRHRRRRRQADRATLTKRRSCLSRNGATSPYP